MASVYRRDKTWWLCYRANGKLVRKSLGTKNAKIARDKLKETEYLLATKRLGLPSRTPLAKIPSDYYAHMRAHKKHKSAESDISRLRIFFSEVTITRSATISRSAMRSFSRTGSRIPAISSAVSVRAGS